MINDYDTRKTLTGIATAYIGEKEKKNNSGFENPFLESKLKAPPIAWCKGWSWCAAIVKLWVVEYYNNLSVRGIDHETYISLLSVGVMTSYTNLKKKYPVLYTKTPGPDTIVYWQHYERGRATPYGHTGICTSSVINDNGVMRFATIEGNTGVSGSRNGDRVATKSRILSYNIPANNGLRLLGFFLLA